MPIPVLGAIAASIKAAPAVWAAGTALAGTVGNFFLQNRAYKLQQSQYQQTMEREDQAVSRRMADMLNAGLSPTLAAGSPASTSSAPTPVERKISLPDLMSIMQGQANLTTAEKQASVLDAQAKKYNIDNLQSVALFKTKQAKLEAELARIYADINRVNEVTALHKIKQAVDNHDFGFFQKWKIPSGAASSKVSNILSTLEAIGSLPEKVVGAGTAAAGGANYKATSEALKAATVWRSGQTEAQFIQQMRDAGLNSEQIRHWLNQYKK